MVTHSKVCDCEQCQRLREVDRFLGRVLLGCLAVAVAAIVGLWGVR